MEKKTTRVNKGKNMNFVYFTDIHFDKNISKSYVRDDGVSSWTHCQLNIIDQILDYVISNKIEHVFFGGDLFEIKNRIPQDLYNSVWDKLSLFKYKEIKLYLNTGNHDFHSKISSSLRPFSNIATVVTEPTDFTFNIPNSDLIIRVCPYGHINDDSLTINDENKYIIMTHEDIAGSRYGLQNVYSKSTYEPSIFEKFYLVINAHIHLPQRIGNNIINAGAVMRHNFGETHKTYFYHYADPDIKKIEIECPEFIILDGFSKRIKNKIDKDDYNFYRIDISVEELSDPIFKKYNVFPNIIKNKEKKKRMVEEMSIEEEIRQYIELSDTNLNKEKLFEIGRELLERNELFV